MLQSRAQEAEGVHCLTSFPLLPLRDGRWQPIQAHKHIIVRFDVIICII